MSDPSPPTTSDGVRRPPDPARGAGSRAMDVGAVVLLIIGGLVLPIVGWALGVGLLWGSSSWTAPEKVLGTAVVPGGLLLPAAMLFLASPVQLPQAVGIALVVAATVAPFVVGGFLLHRADVRRELPRPGR